MQAENRRRFEEGTLSDYGSQVSNPMFEARDKVVKVHAVNMKSKQVK